MNILKLGKHLPFRSKLYDIYLNRLKGERVIEIEGFKMLCDFNTKNKGLKKAFAAYYFNKIHEPATTELFKETIKKGDRVLDLGANLGYFSLLAASKGCEVWAVEPESENYKYLCKNFNLNAFKDYKIIQAAVGDKGGEIKLFKCGYDSGHHTIKQANGIKEYKEADYQEQTEIVPMERIDYFVKDMGGVDIIKMDIEGAEALAFQGMSETICKNKNLKMFIEYFPFLIRKMGNNPEKFIKKLLRKFEVWIIPDDYNAPHQLVKINKPEDIILKGEKDHFNLYVKRK